MSDVAEARRKLSEYAAELDKLSKNLADVQRLLEPIEQQVRDDTDDFIAGMYERWERGEGKWPSEDAREVLARRALDPELRNRYDTLSQSRKRMQKRISDLKASVEAQRSVLSSLKLEMEASG